MVGAADHGRRRVGERLGGDPLIFADAAETRIGVLRSISTLAGLVLYSPTGAAWLGELVENENENENENDE